MAKNTIKVKSYLNVIEEYTATAAAITPGMLIEMDSSSLVKAHATAGGNMVPMFALEDELQGKTIDDAYANSAKIQCWIPQRGEIVNAIIIDGTAITTGDLVISNGDGRLKKYVAEKDSDAGEDPSNHIIGMALETVASTSSDSEKRCLVRIY